jgi:signal transduction histidine kinase/CheY-like chemotaxis protein
VDGVSVQVIEPELDLYLSVQPEGPPLQASISAEAEWLHRSPVWRAWTTGETVYRPDLGRDDPFGETDYPRQWRVVRATCVADLPFAHGTVAINSTRPSAFSDQQIELAESVARVLDDAYGRLVDMVRMERDQASVAEGHSRYEAVIGAASGVAYERDWLADRYTFLGDGIERLTGYPADELTPTIYEGLLEDCIRYDTDPAAIRDIPIFATVTDQSRIYRADQKLRHRDGRTVWIADSAIQERGSDGELIRTIGVMFDITARKRQEEEHRRLEGQMQQLQRLDSLAVLAGGIAHDFNNLLMGVLGNASLALLNVPDDGAVSEALGKIETAAVRASDLAKQMLAYSGRGRVAIERVDLPELVGEMADLLRSAVSRKATLSISSDDDTPCVEGDPTQLRQVIMNLITNASDALEDQPGLISLRTHRVEVDEAVLSGALRDEGVGPGEYVVVDVSDTGRGMDEATRERIFDPFYSTKPTGRGLGLAAVLGIIRSHGGAVRVYTEPGEGTSVRVMLPTAAGWGAEEDESVSSAGSSSELIPGTVLVVDDEDMVRGVARAALAHAGYEVLEATDGEAGLEQVQSHADEIQAVILDMTMPRLSGEEALAGIRQVRPDVPVLLSSGFGDLEAVERLLDEGGVAFIQKPYRASELIDALNELVSR